MVAVVFSFACGAAQLSSKSVPGEFETGLAVYYSDKLHGKKTASDEIYDRDKMTAAHKHLPFGSVVRVVNLANRRTVEVLVNDRGPFDDSDRIIDLSYKAAQRLDMLKAGVTKVRLELVSTPQASR